MADNKKIPAAKKASAKSGKIGSGRPPKEILRVKITGVWKIGTKNPSASQVQNKIESLGSIRRVGFFTENLTDWDSSLLTFLIKISDYCTNNNLAFDKDGLPEGVQKLIALATAVPERKGARKESTRESFFNRVGESTLGLWQSTIEILSFIGEAFIAFLRFLVGKASFRASDLGLFIQQCGANALPIVSLISFLVGLILAFVGAVQLAMFGAQIYVADLVGIAMLRVMGAIMAGIVMSGRTGAAFAAQLGTMQVNEEIDALKTMGVSPMEFLVLPRMLALVVMMPLLCIYADLMGILGGLVVGVGMLDISITQYLVQTKGALNLKHFFIGIFQAGVFGVLVALAGCLRGIQCGRSASAVGDATTSAVVTSIVAIIVATAIVTVGCNVLGI
ncbi:ABC-type transport system involved in resistance to organic solvents, permease component [Olavius sp. associated proteobacterium Delta 1]|nr:ABC-type transport system involved in resistance to organic solvents, permease component [Olavius sp. associated proteobacterium Delta 1]